jgi:DNA-binding NarL/FixJ family response regulator
MTGPVADEVLDAVELDVVRGLADGLTNPAIAGRLRISEAAVRRRLVTICVKLGSGPDRAGIVGAAIRTGQLVVPQTGEPPARFDEPLFDVLVLMARARTNREIAADLDLSLETVKSRMQKLFMVLDARTRSHAVMLGVRCGVLRLVPVRDRVSP